MNGSLSEPSTQKSTFQRDLLASIVVFLVALPLCIGIAVAVGVSPARALITGIIGGIVVGKLSGSPLQVSGPAAGLFVIVADLLTQQKGIYLAGAGASLDPAVAEARALEFALLMMGVCVFLAGVLQFVAGRLKLGQWFRAVSPAVIEGMLAGIGVLIFASQFHVMADHDPHYEGRKAAGGLEYLATIPEAIWKVFTPDGSSTHHLAAATGMITILVILIWQRWAPQRVKLIPAPLVAVVIAALFASIAGLDVRRLEVPGNLMEEVSFPTLASIQSLVNPSLLLSAVVIAIVASAETLLCATAIDQMHSGQRTRYDQELSAQGIGNMLCGLLGALPMTGVIVRSSTNVQAGAQTRLSTILHGVWLLVFVVAFPAVLAFIPKACLGAILVFTGIKLMNFKTLRRLWIMDKSEAAIFVITMTIIVVEDLLMGVVAGIVLSALKLLVQFSYLKTDLRITSDQKKAQLCLEGAATFIRLPRLASTLEKVPVGAELHVDFHELSFLDHACMELLTNWARQHESTGGRLVIDWDSLHACFKSDRPRYGNGNGNGVANGGNSHGNGTAGNDPSTAEQTAETTSHKRAMPAS